MGDPDTLRTGGNFTAPAIALASGVVFVAALLTGYRLSWAADPETLLRANGARALLAAGAGALLGTSGSLQRSLGPVRPLRGLEILSAAVAAAAAGIAISGWLPASASGPGFVLAAAAGGFLGWRGARALDRDRRASNLGVLALFVVLIPAAMLSSVFGITQGSLAPVVAWLLGDLSGASAASGTAVVLAVALLLGLAIRTASRNDPTRARTVSLVAGAISLGAVGPLAFIGSAVPQAVHALAADASAGMRLWASAAAAAASVALIDAGGRLLLGGYAGGFNINVAVVALPALLLWNRARLRRRVGAAGPLFEVAELALIALASAGALAFVLALSGIIDRAT